MEQQPEKRRLHALRKHVDELLAAGAVIVSRDPVTLLCNGQRLKIRLGMLIGYSALPDLVPPLVRRK